MEVTRIAGALGAEVLGVDLSKDIPAEAIRRAFLEHQVIFFRDQALTPAQFMAFARRMGRPIEYPFVRGIEGFPEVIEVKKLEHERYNFGGIWHSDTAARARTASRSRAAALRSTSPSTPWSEPIRRPGARRST